MNQARYRGQDMHGKEKELKFRVRSTPFIALFRTTPPRTICPNFFVLAHASGCAFHPSCSYCYLKSSFWYLKKNEAFTNMREMISQVRAWIRRDDLETYVLNAGNLSDSLVFEPRRPMVKSLIETFREHAEARNRKHTLLLVTKGGIEECRSLFETRPCGNVVVSFSVNNPRAARRYESGAVPVGSRLAAARNLLEKGWRVRIRIDPMILGFGYRGIASEVKKLKPELVTLGTLRAESSLYRFAGRRLFKDLEPPPDKKSLGRYPLEKRIGLYRQAMAILENTCPIGLCEEPPAAWDALGLDKKLKSCNCTG